VGREAAGVGENLSERLSVAGVRGIGVSGFVEDRAFLNFYRGKAEGQEQGSKNWGRTAGEEIGCPFTVQGFPKGEGSRPYTSRTSEGFRLG